VQLRLRLQGSGLDLCRLPALRDLAGLVVRRIVAAIVVAAIALAAFAVANTSDDKAPPGGRVANLWVAPDGCTTEPVRPPAPVAYGDAGEEAIACSLDQALGAAQGGDTVRIRSGTYGAQRLSGPKAATVTFAGDDAAHTVFTGTVTLTDRIELRNVTVSNDAHDFDALGLTGTQDVTLRDVRAEGDYVHVTVRAVHDFAWLGGRLGDFDGSIQKHTCSPGDSIPLLIGPTPVTHAVISRHIVIDGVTFSDFEPSGIGEGGCTGDPNLVHLEVIRVDGPNDDVTIRRNTFLPNKTNTAVIFLTPFEGGKPTRVRIAGNLFRGSPNVPIDAGDQSCSDYVIAYNTFRASLGSWGACASFAGTRFVGNISGHPSTVGFGDPSCSAVAWVDDLRQSTADPRCTGGDDSGNRWVSGPDYEIGNLGLDPTLHLRAGSPAIDAGEAPGPGALCGDAALGLDRDIDGDRRPAGGRCDAGADER
jgi:hypothetical protein